MTQQDHRYVNDVQCLVKDHHDILIDTALLVLYPNLSEEELKVAETIVSTMWDFHWESALYVEVVARELPMEYFTPRKELPPEILETERHSIFDNESEVEEVISSLVSKNIFLCKEEEFRCGTEDCQRVQMERVITFARDDLYRQIENIRIKLGLYY